MGLSTDSLDEHGYAACTVCRKKKYVSELETCIQCQRFVCTSCSKKMKFHGISGIVCKKCETNL